MKFKEEESRMIWESFRSPQTPENRKLDRYNQPPEEDFEDEFEDDYGDDGLDDEFDEFDDGAADFANDGMDSSAVVMEFEPEAPVEPMTSNNEVLISELKKLSDYASKLYSMKDQEFDDWMISAVTIASTYVSDVFHRMDAKQDSLGGGFEQADDFSEF